MRNLMLRLWHDDGGALIAAEWLLIATILVIGAIVGVVAVRKAIVEELCELSKDVFSMHHHHRHHDRDDDGEMDRDPGGDQGNGEDGHEHGPGLPD
jgi:hypothetical protein